MFCLDSFYIFRSWTFSLAVKLISELGGASERRMLMLSISSSSLSGKVFGLLDTENRLARIFWKTYENYAKGSWNRAKKWNWNKN